MEKTGGSRLLQMQARFQQKQLQEREMKIASLYEAQQARALDRVRHSPSSVPSPQPPAPMPHPTGKVRQMFEERRTKGIDKSYPLQPIHNTERHGTKKGLPNGFTKVMATPSNSSTRINEKKSTTKTKSSTSLHTVKKESHKNEKNLNGAGDVNHNHVQNVNSMINNTPQTNGVTRTRRTEVDEVDNSNYRLEDETFPEAMAPASSPRTPMKQPVPQRPPRKSPPVASPTRARAQQPKAPIPPQRKPNSASNNNKAQGAMKPGNRARPGASTTGSGKTASSEEQVPGVACAVCGRRFAPDRLQRHEEICRKAGAKKRKPFDALKHRLAGTEAEAFIGKIRKSAAGTTSSTKVHKPLNNTWRQKHQDFINAIRSAKQVQAHLNAGGKLSDLPPPPPSENPDYVQCPHCNRRFNQQAAERHIPKCATFEFNKSKPSTTRKK